MMPTTARYQNNVHKIRNQNDTHKKFQETTTNLYFSISFICKSCKFKVIVTNYNWHNCNEKKLTVPKVLDRTTIQYNIPNLV